MNYRSTRRRAAHLLGILTYAWAAGAWSAPNIDPEAGKVLRAMSDALQAAPMFSVRIDARTTSGVQGKTKVADTTTKMTVGQPNLLRLESDQLRVRLLQELRVFLGSSYGCTQPLAGIPGFPADPGKLACGRSFLELLLEVRFQGIHRGPGILHLPALRSDELLLELDGLLDSGDGFEAGQHFLPGVFRGGLLLGFLLARFEDLGVQMLVLDGWRRRLLASGSWSRNRQAWNRHDRRGSGRLLPGLRGGRILGGRSRLCRGLLPDSQQPIQGQFLLRELPGEHLDLLPQGFVLLEGDLEAIVGQRAALLEWLQLNLQGLGLWGPAGLHQLGDLLLLRFDLLVGLLEGLFRQLEFTLGVVELCLELHEAFLVGFDARLEL